MSANETPFGLTQQRLPLSLLAAAGFLSALGARIVDPLLAVLARDFETSIAATSALIAAFTLPYGLNQLFLGPLGDRYGKLRVLFVALTGYTIFMTACAFATQLPTLILLRACAGACSAGLIPTCLAYIGDSVPYAQRQVALSRFLTGVVMAQTLSGPLGGLFGEFFGWRAVLLILGGVGLVVTIWLARRMRGLPAESQQGAVFNRRNYAALVNNALARRLLVVTLIEGALLPGVFPFVAPYLVDQFDLSYLAVGLILSAFGPGAMIYTYFAAVLVRRLGEAGLVLVGGMVIAGSFLTAIMIDFWPLFILLQMALGLGYFMLHSVMQARATELLPQARATAVSSFVFMLFLGQSLGALGMGGAIGLWGYHVAFLLAIIGTVILTIWLTFYIRWSHPVARPNPTG